MSHKNRIQFGYEALMRAAHIQPLFEKGDAIIPNDMKNDNGESAQDILGRRVVIAYVTPVLDLHLTIDKDGLTVWEGTKWIWPEMGFHPFDIINPMMYRRATKEEIEKEMTAIDSDIQKLEHKKELLMERHEMSYYHNGPNIS